MGDLDALSREFAREHSDRLWKQLVVPRRIRATRERGPERMPSSPSVSRWRRPWPSRCRRSSGSTWTRTPASTPASESLRAAPPDRLFRLEAAARHRHCSRWLAAAFVAAGVFANVYPFAPDGSTEALTALHLPIALWLVVGIAYAGGRWSQVAGRMDFIRFSGELFIYYVLIALGGGVLTAFMAMMFQAIGIDAEPFFESWLLPCGAAGAVLVASWLVEAKQSVIENMAPVLTRLFTPLFAAVLVTFLGTLLWTGRGVDIERDMLIAFDLLLVVVLGLLLYSVSARDPAIAARASSMCCRSCWWSARCWPTRSRCGPSPRASPSSASARTAWPPWAMNVILLVNLAWSAVLYIRFLRGRGSFAGLERWQTDYLPVYAVWAAIVVIVFPPVFGYI